MVLNVDHSVGLQYNDGYLRSVNYGKDSCVWKDLENFKYFEAEVYNLQGVTSLRWRSANDGQFAKICANIKDHKIKTTAVEVGVYCGDDWRDRFLFRRSKMTDNHGARPVFLTNVMNDKTYALTATDPRHHTYSTAYMKEFTDASDLDSWSRLYFAKKVPMKDAHEVWSWVKGDSTYYFFNRYSSHTMTTEVDENHQMGVDSTWGDFNRFTLVPRDSPYFDLFSYAKKTRDRTFEGSDYRVRTEAGHLTIGIGGTVAFAFHKAGDDGRWGFFISSVDKRKMVYNAAADRILDTSDGEGTGEQWQMIRVFNDAVPLALSNGPDL